MDTPAANGVWVGNYGGGIGVPVGAPLATPLELPLSVILEEDLDGQQVTVGALRAYLLDTNLEEESGAVIETPGVVVAVVDRPLPTPASTLVTSGSEGGGGGSEGSVTIPVSFAECSEPLADGWYRAVVEVEVTADGRATTTWALVPVLVE